MPKLTEKITDRLMRDLAAPAKGNTLYYDPELPGFAVRVTHKGARAFVLVYHFGGVERRDTIGEASAWRAKAARDVAECWRRDIRLKIDPRGEPEPDQADKMLFLPLAGQFLAHSRTKRGRPLRLNTVREYRRALLTYAAPLHAKAVDEVRRSDAADLIRTTAVERGATTAMRTRAAGSRFYSWLIANGKAENNPFVGTEGYDTPKRERVLTDAELAALWAATAEPGDFHLILRVMLGTGCRRAEAGGMRWSELAGGIWTVPGSRVKNHRTLALPLPRQMRPALEAWPRRLGRDHLFGQGDNGFQAWSQSKRRLDARLGFARDWDLHDIRRSIETRMAGLGIPKDHVNRVLNHAMAPIAQHYDHHDYLPEKAAALQLWADALERIVGEGPQPNVVPLRRSGS
jgi:integrase